MTDDLHIRVAGRAGRITFTRPKALNALNHAMSLAIEAALDGWRDDPAVALVVIDAEGERAFCAGGDIAAMYRAGREGGGAAEAAIAFWRDEYRMNAKISEFPKPMVAFMQGFVMGGGVGVGGHAALRIAGDSTRIAMPETGIGLIPDVGGSWLLSRAPGRLGEYLGLTGDRMAAGDAILAGFADRYLPEADWPEAIAAMERTGAPTLPDRPAPQAALAPHLPLIDRIFALPDLPAILDALAAEPAEFAAETHRTLARMSPLSMAATLALVRGARDLDLRAALGREFRFTARALAATDFLEGVRAQIIDKDRQPRWLHADAAAVTPEEVAALLSPLPAGRGLDWEG